MSKAHIELERAVAILAKGTCPLQRRLSEAWTKIESHNLTSKRDSAESIGGRLDSMREELLADGGTVDDAFANMDDEKCRMWIQRILDLYSEALSSSR